MCTQHERYLDMISGVDINDDDWVDHLELIDYDVAPVEGKVISYNNINRIKELILFCKGETRSLGLDVVSINKKTDEVIREDIYSNF